MFGLVGKLRPNSGKEIPGNESLDNHVILVNVPGGRIHMKTLNMKLSDELYEALKESARDHGLSMAELVRIALRRYVLSDNSSEGDVLTLKDLSKAVSELRAHLTRLEEENMELRRLLGKGSSHSSSKVRSSLGGSGIDREGHVSHRVTRSALPVARSRSLSGDFSASSSSVSSSRDNRGGGMSSVTGSYASGSTGVSGTSTSRRQSKSTGRGVYEDLALEVMRQDPFREWGIRELFEEVMRGRGKELEEQGVVLNPDSFKDRIIRMAKKGVIRKVSRGKYSLS